MTDAFAIDVRQLRKQYRDGWLARKNFNALKGVDLTVRRGEVFGLLGPNGAGKTTLIKILLGIVRRTGGDAYVLGNPAGTRDARRRIGYLPENLNFPAHHTAQRAMEFYGRLSSVPESVIQSRGKELLKMVGLAGRERELVRKYSKGMRQRLGLAQAMLHDPELLIMDEPTDGLDPVGRSEIRKLITELRNQGKTVFLNSHILQEVELVCDRVAILAGGQLRGVGTPKELTQKFHGALDTKVRMELAGSRDAIEKLRALTQLDPLALPDSHWQLSTHATEQAEVDRLIDQIRQLGISLLSLERSRLTLEEVFLSAIQQATESDARLLDTPPLILPAKPVVTGMGQSVDS
jgi:ABC-2 type transport system ATP-binding protein